MKLFFTIILSIVIFSKSLAQEMQLSVTLIDNSQIANNGLYFNGSQGVNYQFSPRISPHGDCIDVVNEYVFVTWYKGGMDKRNLMLSRKKLNDPTANWITIEFPHQHVGYRGTDPTIGDSHNTAAIGVSTIDGTIHLLYDMHAYGQGSLPTNFFNYSVSEKNKAFVPDEEFNLSIFKPKQNYLKLGEDYNRVTYPMLHTADDGSLLVRYRIGGSGNGDIYMAHYDGTSWTDNWLYSDGTIPFPDRYSLYGGEKFLNGKFYSCFSVRYSTNNELSTNNGYYLNSGFYFAYTNSVPTNQSGSWFDAFENNVSLPIGAPNAIKVAEPGDDYGTSTAPKSSSDPAFTVTESGAIHIITRVDNTNVHYYKAAGTSAFLSNGGGLIPNPDVRGEIYSYKNHVFMVELLGGKPVVKTTLEAQDEWKIVFSALGEAMSFKHFDAYVDNDKLYVYLMEDINSDACPLHLQVFNLSEIEAPDPGVPPILIEAEDYDTGGQGVGYNDLSTGNSGGVYKTDDVDIEAKAAASNGYTVTHFQSDEWMKYTFQVPTAGIYEFKLFAANRNRDDSIMNIEINGVLYSNVLITRTYDWEVFLESKIPNVSLNQGENTVIITQKRSLSSAPDKMEFVLTASLSIEEKSLQETAIYPNPSNGIFNIKSKIKVLDYALISLQGKTFEKGVLVHDTINLSKYSKGIYFIKLSSDDNVIVKKIVIK